MKVALGQVVMAGPWGGGNRFTIALAQALAARGDHVLYDLRDPEIDIILVTDPRPSNPALAFTIADVLAYLRRSTSRALVVHRINECDQRKGTRTMNFRLRLANACADHTVFISSWLKEIGVVRRAGPASVILNGADARIFNNDGQHPWDGTGPLRIVTHHWGSHPLKGFDVYARLDALLADPPWQGQIEFTYVGNLPKSFTFANARHLAPRDGPPLADVLRGHHVYITASVNEPAGMHHVEGAMCGLPLLYRDSGALPEYCGGYGIPFSGPDDVEGAIRTMMKDYFAWLERIPAYPHTGTKMCRSYLALFDQLMAERDAIVARRRPWRHPLAAVLNRVPW